MGSEAPLWRLGGVFAAALAVSCAALLGLTSVGLQYDECLHAAGAVHLLHSPGPPPSYAYPRAAWVPVGDRWWPLMVIPYAGALKNYLLLGPLAVWGAGAAVIRIVAALLLAGGLWGMWRYLASELSGVEAAAVGVILAVHPALLLHAVYDNGTVGVWILLVGLLAAALERYRRRSTLAAAFSIGLLTGLAVWNRANFLWLVAAVLAAAGVVYGRRMLPPRGHLAAAIAGGAAGSAPLLLYQVASGGEIFRAWRALRGDAGLPELLARRLAMLSETLLLDIENRQIWGGAPPPAWPGVVLLCLLGGGIAMCLWPRRGGDDDEAASRFRRAAALALVLFLLLMFTSRLNVSPHHLVTALPLAAAVVVAGLGAAARRWKAARYLAAAAGVFFLALAVDGNVTAARQMRRTGGVGSWSDAISEVARDLRGRVDGREVVVLDWGLATNLVVASNGDVPVREVFWGATPEQSGPGPSWRSVVYRGGLFLTNARPHFPTATEGFENALAKSQAEFARVEFRERSGAPYARLYDVRPLRRMGRETEARR